jgi:hypothetical protein
MKNDKLFYFQLGFLLTVFSKFLKIYFFNCNHLIFGTPEKTVRFSLMVFETMLLSDSCSP